MLIGRRKEFQSWRLECSFVHHWRSDAELTLETSALDALYGGQLTLSTRLMKPNHYF